MSKHTQGPWYVDTNAKRADYIRATGDELPGKCAIAQMCSRGGWSESNANARLIAAAPNLLEALQEYRSAFGQALQAHGIPFGEQQQQAEALALAAIAKATGGAQ